MNLVGEVNLSRTFRCAHCNASLWGDNGYATSKGAQCVREDRCARRVARQELDAMAARGERPRWRTA